MDKLRRSVKKASVIFKIGAGPFRSGGSKDSHRNSVASSPKSPNALGGVRFINPFVDNVSLEALKLVEIVNQKVNQQ